MSEQFQLEPLNATVLHGSAVRFNATVQGAWKVMTWSVGGFLVTTVTDIGDIISISEQFSARFCSSGDASCVEFTIQNVTRSEGGAVTCSVQGNYGSKTAQLYVQGRAIKMSGCSYISSLQGSIEYSILIGQFGHSAVCSFSLAEDTLLKGFHH